MRNAIPLYLENPLRSKLWRHPYVRKWVMDKRASTVVFPYCQFGEAWQKSTQVFGFNKKWNYELGVRCAWRKEGERRVCSRTLWRVARTMMVLSPTLGKCTSGFQAARASEASMPSASVKASIENWASHAMMGQGGQATTRHWVNQQHTQSDWRSNYQHVAKALPSRQF